jgi:hypothetical protein
LSVLLNQRSNLPVTGDGTSILYRLESLKAPAVGSSNLIFFEYEIKSPAQDYASCPSPLLIYFLCLVLMSSFQPYINSEKCDRGRKG